MMALILRMGRRARRKCCPAFRLHCVMIQAPYLFGLMRPQHLPTGLLCANWHVTYHHYTCSDTVSHSTLQLSLQHRADRFIVQS